MPAPFLSIVTPTYNRADIVLRAVNSVRRQKATFRFEIIVVDDGSTDGTAELFSKPAKDVRFFRLEQNVGVNAARNKGVAEARGTYVMLLDSDDWLLPGAFEEIANHVEELEAINFFGTVDEDAEKMYWVKRSGGYSYRDWLARESLGGEFIPVLKRDVFETYTFDESRFAFESFFWNRVIKKYGVNVFDIPLRQYSHAAENRLSPQLLQTKNAQRRFEDYRNYIDEFEKDLLSFGLRKRLAREYFIAGIYGFLAGKNQQGRNCLRKSWQNQRSFRVAMVWLLSLLGNPFFRAVYSATRILSARVMNRITQRL